MRFDDPMRAKKSLGQHFLHDPDLLSRIASLTGPVAGKTVVEVGPGPGGLTRALLNAGAGPLIAIEADPRFANALSDWPETALGRIQVRLADARDVDEAALIESAGGTLPAKLIANLPYNVATPLLVRWLTGPAWWSAMALMFQKEVADRICAVPGDAGYGRLAVLAQAVSQPRLAMTLPPGAFRPPPKVHSAVVVLSPLPESERFGDLEALTRVTAAAFGQRRKMLRSSLKAAGGDVDAILDLAGIDPTRRAETLSQGEFRALAVAYRAVTA
ncbi:16S rRNA (adenine(1518)-N(6)/adenine(1519)-N(6))-dimethyltransferase RsmA [bacterium]|nr:16S rRNA (adenine(1518)-N(6)/adenine(1519)-N(6))-dimethyltransferase RsmA [bacterium]